ncbi:MAG: sulfatase-like hydrolase/transferase [Actinomycetota bacterium]
MTKHPMRIAITVALAAAAAYAAASLPGDDSGGRRSAHAHYADTSARKPPVIMIVMDEFPGDALLGADGKIDAGRFPHFAELAQTGTWYRNASTVHDSTTKATPAILDSKLPRNDTQPSFTSHPQSVYDLFGRRGYRIVSSEEATSICPPRYCPGAEETRPAILPSLQEGRRDRLRSFFSRVRRGPATFYFKHVLLPHGPYLFLPSGRQSRASWRDPLPGMNSLPGFFDDYLTLHNRQRLLLQIGFVDHELGLLFDRLRRQKLYDKAMIVVTADHGISSEVGADSRRTINRRNADEVAPVPLFIKAPRQARGRTDSSYLRTTDIVPTMADLLGMRMPYRADGRSARSLAVRRRRGIRVINRDFTGTIVISAAEMERRRRALTRRRLRLLGSGDWASLYTGIGANRELIGRRVSVVPAAPRSSVRARLVGASTVGAVNRASLVRPTEVAGQLNGGHGAERDLAVAVNGHIEGVGRSFHLTRSDTDLRPDRQESFAINVPEASLRVGRNRVVVYGVTAGGRLARLAATG